VQRLGQAQNKLLAFRALNRGLKHSFENWRMWYNYMLIATDIGELSEACRALTRVVEERAAKDGESCVDFEVLGHLINAVAQPSEAMTVADINKGELLAPRVLDLFSKTLLPRFSASSQIFRQYGRLLMWQSSWEPALEAYMHAYQSEALDDGTKITSTNDFQEAARRLDEILDVIENLGPRISQADQGKDMAPKGRSTWKFQSRSMIRSFLGRTKETFGDEAEWIKIQDRLHNLRADS
jgi:hypothetical protein